MLDKETVELWILEHACKFCLPAVFKAAWRRCGGRARHGVLPDIYLAMMDLHLAVSGDLAQLSAETVAALERGQQLMEKIFSCDRRLSTHAHLVAKTIISMRIKVLFWYLGGTRSEALAKMNEFFPREGLPLLEKLCPSRAHLVIEFRRFFLPLLAHEDSRVSYMQTDYKQEYGPAFNQHLQSRTQRFLAILQSLLPATPIEQIMSGNGHAVLGSPEGSQECVTMEMVMQCLSGVHGNASRATVQALLELLTMVSPLNPLERPPVHPHLLLQSQSQASQPSEETPCPDSETLDNSQMQTDTVPPAPNSDPSVPKSSAPVPQSVTPGPTTVPSAPAVAAVGTTPPQSARQDQRRKDSSRSTHGASDGVVTRSRSRQETVDRVHAGGRKNTVPATAARKKQLPAIQQRVSLRRKILSKRIARGRTEVQEKPLMRSLKKSSTEKTAAVVVTDSDATVSGVAASEEGVRRSARLMRKRGAEGEKDDNASADDIIDKGPSTSSGESTSLIRRRVPPRKGHWDTQVHIISSSSDNTTSQPHLPQVIVVPDSSSDGLHSDRPVDPDSSLELGNAADAEDSQCLSGRPLSSLTEEGGDTSREDGDMEDWDEYQGSNSQGQGSNSQGQGRDSDPAASPLTDVPSPSSSIIPPSCMEEVEEWDIEDSEPKAEEVQLPDLSRFVHHSGP